MDILYWTEISQIPRALYTGINDNQLNVDVAGFLDSVYSSFSYAEKISNYKAWPDNMTDETVSLLLGFPGGLGILASYYDFCCSEGIGTAMPSLAISKAFNLGPSVLRTSAGVNMAFRYPSANIMDLFQPKLTLVVNYGKNADNGFGTEYEFMPTCEGTHNYTDVSSIPAYQKISCWYGKVWNIGGNLNVGIRPNMFITYNAIDPSERLYNVVSDSGNMEFLARIPLSFQITQGNSVEYVISLLVGLYYASFDHEGSSNWLGGNNAHGLGGCLNVNEYCSIQIASNFIRIPELTADDDEHQYVAKDISVSNIQDIPLSVSVILRF